MTVGFDRKLQQRYPLDRHGSEVTFHLKGPNDRNEHGPDIHLNELTGNSPIAVIRELRSIDDFRPRLCKNAKFPNKEIHCEIYKDSDAYQGIALGRYFSEAIRFVSPVTS